jgi:hypothetical protein
LTKFPLQAIGAPLYLVAVLLVVVPTADSLFTVLPLQLGEPGWRFGATGLLTRAFLTPLLGLLIATLFAALAEQRRVLGALSWLSGIAALGLVLALVLFCLDAIQLRAGTRVELRASFQAASVLAAAKILLAAVACGLLSLGIARMLRGTRSARNGTHEEQGLVRPATGR